MREPEERTGDTSSASDPMALVQAVLRESYLQATEDLRFYAEKVRRFNEAKKAVRGYLAALRACRTEVLSAARDRGIDACRGDQTDAVALTRLFEEHGRVYDAGEAGRAQCIPDRVPPAGVNSVARLDDEIARWEGRLAALGDDAQLANVDLQNILQKQQQTLQMLSNISKALHDTSMAIIRKIGG